MLSRRVSEMPKNWNRRFKHNRDKIKTGDIYELAEVVRNLAIRETEKGLSTGEKQMFTRAKKILASELMYALTRTRKRPRRYLYELLARTRSARTEGRRRCEVALGQIDGRRAGRGRRARRAPWARRGPRRSSRSPGGRCSSGASRRSAGRAGDRRRSSSRCRRGAVAAPHGRDRRRRRRPCARTRSAARSPPAGRATRCIVHDAARPLAEPAAVRPRGAALESTGADAVIAAAPVTDTTKEVDADGGVVSRHRRSAPACGRCRRPQVFRRAVLEAALADAAACSRTRPTTRGWSSGRGAPSACSIRASRTSRSPRR